MNFHQCSLDDLLDYVDVVFEKAASPGAQIMIDASLIRRGVALKLDGNPQVLTVAARETLIRKSDLEWEVERARRAYMPSAPCRLTCL